MDGRWNGQGKGIRHYAEADGDPDMDHDDLVQARRTVNVQDKAAEIAGYAKAFEAALVVAGMPERILEKAPLQPASPIAALPSAAPATPAAAGPMDVLIALIARAFRKGA